MGTGEKLPYLVSEAGVVSVFHDGHDLNGVVANLLDARQDVVSERPVRIDLALGRTEVREDCT